ncbi:MAG: YfhO family protein, partial [Acidobacteria bacterium]|nr:YfhO family protein [Acidobacteriota bacterium]
QYPDEAVRPQSVANIRVGDLLLESAIWLPLIFLFLLRAMRAERVRRLALWASVSGLCLGLSVLAGGLHVVIMEAIVIVTAAAFAGFNPQMIGKPFRNRSWIVTALAAAVVAIIGLCAGAVQLLPSMEYSSHALRWLGSPGALPATQKIPYAYVGDGLWPHGFVGILFAFAFGGNLGGGEVLSPHMGVFPMIAAVIGIWKCWGNLWVRYLAGLALAAFLYSLGSFSLLHGALYALVPRLWMAREAGRFLYLANFALAILAAFGVETLFSEQGRQTDWRALSRILGWCVVAGVAALAIPALFVHPEINSRASFFIVLVFLSYGLFRYIVRGHTGTAARLLMLGLILFDLSALDWSWWNKIQTAKTRTNQLERALSCRGAASFLKSQPGLFRVQVVADEPPNIGDLFQVPAINGGGATLLKDYLPLLGRSDLLNARYLLRPASAGEPGAVYQDAYWKVYENPNAYPRAWVVHEMIVEPSSERLVKRRDSPEIDLHEQALLDARLETALEPRVEGAGESVTFRSYRASRMELSVRAESQGLLVLSEIFYPGWRATVNGAGQPIHKVDGGLRGIVVSKGESRVVVSYTPWSVYIGAFLTLGAFLGVLGAFILRRREPPSSTAKRRCG